MEIYLGLSLMTLVSQEVRLINDLNSHFKFDHNIFLLDSSTDITRYVSCGNHPKTLFTFTSTSAKVMDKGVLHEVISKNVFVIVVLESLIFVKNLNLLQQIAKIHLLNRHVKCGIFFQTMASMNDISNGSETSRFLTYLRQYIHMMDVR